MIVNYKNSEYLTLDWEFGSFCLEDWYISLNKQITKKNTLLEYVESRISIPSLLVNECYEKETE